jgi:hypothetical protein
MILCLNVSAQQLITYDNIPGRQESDHYNCRVKLVNEPDSAWRDVFVLQTEGKDNGDIGYYPNIRGWTASWIAFESDFNGDDVIVEISKKDGSPITQTMVRPESEAAPASISNGKAYVIFSEPTNINVDINGQMENNYTGYGYTGPDVHTISLFANPVFNVPDINDPGVRVLLPGEDINTIDRNTWDTIIFAPGVHDIGMPFQILSNETLFIPGDALVKGNIHPVDAWGSNASQNWSVYGSGTISNEDMVRDPNDKSNIFRTFANQAEGIRLEGFVVADPVFHTFNINNSGGVNGATNVYKNLKILAWRLNSDGINAYRNSEVSDCFFRVQDDAFYYGQVNVNQHDNVVWNDANGAALFLQNVQDGSTCTFEDVTVIYSRAYWHWWDGGRIISMRTRVPGKIIKNVHVKNIIVEDPLPAFPPFYGTMQLQNENESPDNPNADIELENIVFENIYQAHDGVITALDNVQGKPRNTLVGLDPNRPFENILFKNCYFNGVILNCFEDGDFLISDVDESTVVFNENADTILQINAPDVVSPDEAVEVTVDFALSQQRDITAFIQLDSPPWTNYGQVSTTASACDTSTSLNFTVQSDIPIANDAYKIVVALLPVGGTWSDRIDDSSILDVDAVDDLSIINQPKQELIIYPNPSVGRTKVQSNHVFQDLKVYAISGKLIIDKNVNKKAFELDVSSFKKGMYFIEIISGKGKSIKKLIVK